MCQIQADTHSKTRVRIPARDYSLKAAKTQISCNIGKSAKNPIGIFLQIDFQCYSLFDCLYATLKNPQFIRFFFSSSVPETSFLQGIPALTQGRSHIISKGQMLPQELI